MRYGHVAVVARVVSSREVLVDHANWAPHRGHGRGQVSKMVAVTDVSAGNDWTEVRVWNASTRDFGTRTYPTYGFIYPASSRGYLHQAVASATREEPGATALRRLSPPGDPVLATADRQIAAALAESCATASTTVEANAGEPKPANKPVESKPGETKPAAASAGSEARSVEAAAVEAKPAETRMTVVAVNEVRPTMVATAATANIRASASAGDGVWEGDSAAAKRAGSGRY